MSIFSIFKLLLGLAFFLFGMRVMSENLERMAGGKLEHMLKKMTANPFVSFLLGAGITIAVQSSSASTVMLVGLVNSGIMQLSQTIYVIFGAHVGTTLTSWVLSLSGIESNSFAVQMLKPENFSPILAIIGILLVMMSKNERRQSIGTIMVGFAVLMSGMEFMSDAVSPLAQMPEFGSLLIRFNNPLFGVLIGTVVTAVIQSSAASVGILQALSLTGQMTCGMAFPIIMGQNIGTCATAMISCVGTNANAKRVAVIHLTTSILGTIICLPLFLLFNAVTPWAFDAATATPWNIAMMHTVFNIVATAFLMPFPKLLLKLSEWLVRDKNPVEKRSSSTFTLDERLLRSPSVAISECDNYTVKMSQIAGEMLENSILLLADYDEKLAAKVLKREASLDALEDALGTYLVKLSSQALSTADSQKISKMLHTIGDFERLGDHAVNLVHSAKEIDKKNLVFSEEAKRELSVLTAAIREILQITMLAYAQNDARLAAQVEPLEQVIDRLIAAIRDSHIRRLQTGVCTIELGFVLSDLLNNYERISDHCSNIAVAIIELLHNSFDTHRYLSQVKVGSAEFGEAYDEFRARYHL